MKKILTSLIAATMLVPSTVLASSIRPGARPPTYKPKAPTCLVEEKWKPCLVVIDETGVTLYGIGKITNVVQWTTEEKDFNIAGGIVGGAAGAGVGFAAGLGSCAFLGPFCLITAPAIMNTGMGVGGAAGGKGTGKFFTIVGDDEGNRLIQEFYVKSGKDVRKKSKQLLKTTGLAEGEVKG